MARKAKKTFMFEIFLFFFLLNCLNFIFFSDDPGFTHAAMHPYWVAVLLISARYGFYPGLLAGIIANLNMLVFMFGGIPTREIIERVVEEQGIFLPLAFIIVGALLGGIREKYMNSEKDLRESIGRAEDELESAQEMVKALGKTKDLLEKRIVRETSTVKLLYDAARKIESMVSGNAYDACLKILADNFQVQRSSAYLIEDDYFVLKAAYGWDQGDAIEEKVRVEESIMSLAAEKKQYLSVKNILTADKKGKYLDQYGKVLAMFPMYDEQGGVKGMLNIEQIDFMLFNRPNLQLINLVTEWVNLAIYNRDLRCDVGKNRIWNDLLGVYTYLFFDNAIELEMKRSKRFSLSLAVSFFKIQKYVFFGQDVQDLLARMAASVMKRMFRETDMIFEYKYKGTFVVISPLIDEDELGRIMNNISEEFNAHAGRDIQGKTAPGILCGSSFFDSGMKTKEELLRPAMEKTGTNILR